MFVVITVKNGICYFEAPGIDKYTHVALIELTQEDESTKNENSSG